MSEETICRLNSSFWMKTFHCSHCQHLVFFENIRCLNCGHSLAYLPDHNVMAAVQPDQAYRLCANYDRENVCNWAVPQDDPESLCRACRLTHVIPDLSQPGNATAWYRLEVAKRRLVYTLLGLGLPVVGKKEPNDSG